METGLDVSPTPTYLRAMRHTTPIRGYTLLILFLTGLGCASPETSATEPLDNPQTALDLSFGTDSTLDILTWNIETFPKDERKSADYVVRVLRALDPDIVAVQEIWSIAHLEWVAQTLGNYRVISTLESEESGLAFLLKIGSVEVLTQPQTILRASAYDFGYRPPLELTVGVAGMTVRISNVHFKCCGDDQIGTAYWDEELRRLKATGALKAYLDRLPNGQGAIVLGDWNDSLTDSAESNVFRALLDDTANYRFVDIGLASLNDDAYWSYPSYPSHLDHILVNAALLPLSEAPQASVETIRIEDALPNGLTEYYRYISDHRPVGLRLESP